MDINKILDSLPIVDGTAFREGEEKVYATLIAKVVMVYPLVGKREPQVGFVFGTDSTRATLYLSRYGMEDEKGRTYACNRSEISLETRFIKEFNIIRKLE